ncbi:MAG TPA: hypothetical protein VER32_04050 [Pyrinomonadaceae bacterium]|nr:hypothetical protein [Pyrinomonadaceae bacterium]
MARHERGSPTGEPYKGGGKSPATSTEKERGGAGKKKGAGKRPPKVAKSETGRADRKPAH